MAIIGGRIVRKWKKLNESQIQHLEEKGKKSMKKYTKLVIFIFGERGSGRLKIRKGTVLTYFKKDGNLLKGRRFSSLILGLSGVM